MFYKKLDKTPETELYNLSLTSVLTKTLNGLNATELVLKVYCIRFYGVSVLAFN